MPDLPRCVATGATVEEVEEQIREAIAFHLEGLRAVPLKAGAHMIDVVSPKNVVSTLTELWSPRVIAEVDDAYIKVARVQGSLAWHSHENEDELFLILKGRLRIELEDRAVNLNEGEMFVVPKGVLHNPVADEECHIMLIERKSTLHTGELTTDKTRSLAEQLRPARPAG